MAVPSKPSLVRVVSEVLLAMLLIALGLVSVLAYNYLGLLGVPIGLWVCGGRAVNLRLWRRSSAHSSCRSGSG